MHYLEGLRFCFEMTELAYTRLETALAALAQLPVGVQADSRSALVVSALMDAWAIVDHVDRTRNLLVQLPYLKQKPAASPGVSVFNERTDTIPALRNLVQHMTTELSKPQPEEERPWGQIAWLYHATGTQVKSYLLVPGCWRGGTYAIVGQQDRVPDRVVSRVVLQRKTTSANLTFVHGAMRVLARDLEAAIISGAPTANRRDTDVVYSLEVVVNPGSGAEPPTPE